jgi:PAS domain S-box-containing protein
MSETITYEPTIAILSSGPIKILHVDDDAAFLNMAKQCLELQSDIKVESANSVEEALSLIEKSKFDVIVSDFQMAEKNGLEFLKELKSRNIPIPFILFTGKSRDEVGLKALNLGAFRYMNKGGAPRAAYAELESCIRQAVDYSKAKGFLKSSEKRFQAIFDSSADAIFVINASGEVIHTNKAAQLIMGYAEKEIINALKEHFCQLDNENKVNMQPELVQPSVEKILFADKRVVIALKKKSGEEVFVDLSFSSFIENGQWFGVSTVRDVSDRKRQAVLLEESQQTLKALFSYNPCAIVFTDINRNITDINQSFSDLFGYTLDQIKGKKICDLIVPDNRKEESEMMRELLLNGPVNFNTERKKSDNSIINVNISGGPLIVNDRLLGYFMLYIDISDVIVVQSQLEKALAKAELLNNKIEVLGGFTRHDVRNKLSLISGNLYLATQKCNIDPKLQNYFQEIENTIKNITDIFDFAKTYEMVGVEELTCVNLGQMIQNAIYLFSDLHNVKIINRCENIEVIADSLLTQTFYNLIDNSLKYGEKITTITIYGAKFDDQTFNLFYKDDGVGIEDKHRKNIFKKGYGKGTGFGLYLIDKIIEVYGWTVEENGQFGKGVQFEFKLPLNKVKYC